MNIGGVKLIRIMTMGNLELQKWIKMGWMYGVSYSGDFYKWEIESPNGSKWEGKSVVYPNEDFFILQIKSRLRDINLSKLFPDD